MFCSLPKIQPSASQTMGLINKCLLNETSFLSESQAFYFHRRERKGEEERKVGPPKTAQVQRPDRGWHWRCPPLHSPAVLPGLETSPDQPAAGTEYKQIKHT